MKLYDLRCGDKFKITNDALVPPGEPPPDTNVIYKFDYVDGMYSISYDPKGEIVYLAAWTEVNKCREQP